MEGDFFIMPNQAVPIVVRQRHRMLPNGRFEVVVVALGSDGMLYNNVSIFTPEDYIDPSMRNKIIQEAAEKVMEAMRKNITPENFLKTLEMQAEQQRKLAELRGEESPPAEEPQPTGPAEAA